MNALAASSSFNNAKSTRLSHDETTPTLNYTHAAEHGTIPISNTFDLPIRSFLEAYPHPAFVLEAQALYESLVQRLSVWRTSDPEEASNVNMKSAQPKHADSEVRERYEQMSAHVYADHITASPDREEFVSPLNISATSSSGDGWCPLQRPAPIRFPSEISISGTTTIGSSPDDDVYSPTTASKKPLAAVYEPEWQPTMHYTGKHASKFLLDALDVQPASLPSGPKLMSFTADISEDVVVDSLVNLPVSERAGFYPYVVGKAADVGWNRTWRSLLVPLWANAAWYNMLLAMNISSLRGSEEGILDLLSIADAKRLFDFLRDVVATAANITTAANDIPPKSVRLDLTSRDSGDSGYSSDASRSRASTSPTMTEAHVGIELAATLIDSSSVVSTSSNRSCLAGQYLVITSIASNFPSLSACHAKDAASEPVALGPSVGAVSPSREEEGFPFPTSSTGPVPSGFVLENRKKPTRVRSQKLRRGERSVRAPLIRRLSERQVSVGVSSREQYDDGIQFHVVSPKKKPDSDMMEWAELDKPTQVKHNAHVETRSPFVPGYALSSDPFCTFLETLTMGRFILAYPWHETSLGPLASWSGDLRSLIAVMLASPFRESLWVGKDGVMLYNDAYIKTASQKHPWLLGKPYSVGWAEVWETMEPSVQRVCNGETIAAYDHLLFLNRNPGDSSGIRREETYHIWAMIPSRGSSGEIIATMNPSFETTSRVLAERRLGTIRDLVLTLSLTRTHKEFFDAALGSLGRNPCDMPFVICYSCRVVEPPKRAPLAKGIRREESYENRSIPSFHLEYQGSLGISKGHACAPAEVTFTSDRSFESYDQASQWECNSSASSSATVQPDEHSPWPFREACLTGKPIFVPDLGSRLTGFERRGWDEDPRAAVVIPIAKEGGRPQAVLIIGLNPRRPFDEAYASWLQLIAKQLATHIAITEGYSNEVAKTHELAQLDHAKTMFFSNVNHELRTPLTLILGPLNDVLADQDTFYLPDDVRDRLQVVSRNANRLLSLVNGLLDFSRLEAGRIHAYFRPVNLSAVTADLASLFRSAIGKSDIRYVVDVPEGEAEVWLDLDLWEKVVFNIIGNAFKYCLRGSIEVRVQKCKRYAEFSVTDTGCGIAESELGRIFERFHRVESTSRSQEGTGIGLALTQEIVKVLGGTLDVQSVVNEGTTFFVRLPYGNAHLPADQLDTSGDGVEDSSGNAQNLGIVEEVSRWASDDLAINALDSTTSADESDIVIENSNASCSDLGSGSGFGSHTYPSINIPSHDALSIRNSVILLADDNADMRKYCRSILAKKFQVVEVADGQAALDYAREFSPDLIVSDVMMPRLGGYDLLRILREDPATSIIPIILLSAHAGTEARVDGLLAGADDYLAKPFSSKELSARANTHLHLGKMRRELEKQVQERTRALVESEVRYRSLAEEYSAVTNVSPVGIFSLTAEGLLHFVNPPWHTISGHPQDRPLDDWVNSIHPDEREASLQIWNNAIQNALPLCVELRWLHGDRTQCDVRPQFDVDRRLTGWVGSLTNIEERRRLEVLHLQAVEQRATDAEEMRQHQELFIDITSHEMRNLNSGIYNSADLVVGSLQRTQAVARELQQGQSIDLKGFLSTLEQDREAAENIMLCSSAQARIADDILRYSKLSMGLLSISKSDFNLIRSISEVIAMFSLESSKKQIQLSLSVGPGLAKHDIHWVNADPHRLSQVLINFLTNAMRFTVASALKTIVVRVEVTATIPQMTLTAMRVGKLDDTEISRDAFWLTCSVVDSGRGLSPDDSAKLFERFAQAKPKTDGVGGYGLGLFVSRKIVELHHGFITVESQEGAGSTFSFSVPVTKVDPPTEGIDPISNIASSPLRVNNLEFPSIDTQFSPPSLENSKGRHILIVEDNPINTKVLVRQMMNNGFTTTTADNGQVALDILLARETDKTKPKIDVVLMDIEMPVCDGLYAIGQIRKYEASGRLGRTKVIAVTGNARQEQLDGCRAAGFQHGVATKPYRLPELLSMIEKACLAP